MNNIPTEILALIVTLLSRRDLHALCLTNNIFLLLARPRLYSSLELSTRQHLTNLKEGSQISDSLAYTLKHDVRTFRFLYRQSESDWLIYEARYLLPLLENLRDVELSGFRNLRVERFIELAPYLTRAQHISFSYCELFADHNSRGLGLSVKTNEKPFQNVRNLTFIWTDFTTPSITLLLRRLPHLKRIDWRANHNRASNVNDSSMIALMEHCPNIEAMDVQLQEVREESFCNAIRFYTTSLHDLRIRADSAVLAFVAFYAVGLKNLELAYYSFVNDQDSLLRVIGRCTSLERLVLDPIPLDIPEEIHQALKEHQGVLTDPKRVVIERGALDSVREKLRVSKKELLEEPTLN